MAETLGEISHMDRKEIPAEIQLLIDKEVNKDVAPLFEEGDEDTAEALREIMHDLRTTTFSVLQWIQEKESIQLVLYPASGHDTIPKLAFGEDKVVHTSLEDSHGDRQYYDQLGPGMKVVADNKAPPFADNSFETICLLDSQEEIIGNNPDIYLKMLKKNGLVVLCKNNTLNPDDDRIDTYSKLPSLEPIPIPDDFQMEGSAQLEFAVFRKV